MRGASSRMISHHSVTRQNSSQTSPYQGKARLTKELSSGMCYLLRKLFFGDFIVGSRISDRHVNTVVNTTENAMSSTDIFISN